MLVMNLLSMIIYVWTVVICGVGSLSCPGGLFLVVSDGPLSPLSESVRTAHLMGMTKGSSGRLIKWGLMIHRAQL